LVLKTLENLWKKR